MALSQAGLSRTWWKDAANHFVYGRTRLPLRAIDSKTSHELIYRSQGTVERLRPFVCLAYVHLQKDQHGALLPHAAQCIFIGYPTDYKGWRFWVPQARQEIVTDSKPRLSGRG